MVVNWRPSSAQVYAPPLVVPPALGPTYATQAFNALTELKNSATSISIPYITPPSITIPAAPGVVEVSPPSFETITWSLPPPPATFNQDLNVDALLPDPFDESPPTLVFAGAPSSFTDLPPDAPGVDLQYITPSLSVSLPAPPSLLSLNIAPFSGVNIPTFAEDAPTLTAVAPNPREYTSGSMYSSALLTTLSTTLKSRIENGGTGLPPDIENALWDRAREREYRQLEAALADLDRMEAFGYAAPPGVYMSARIKLQTELNYNAANASREIAIKQAELELTNILKALETSTQLESRFIEYANQIEQRTFEATKFATQADIEVYNAKVRAFAQYVDAYKAKIAVYDAQIRGETAKVEVYRTQIAAEEAKAQINTALVNQYKVSADIALSAIEIYKAEIAGIQAKAEIEKTKVMIFGEQIKGYVARINAYTAQIEGYKAQTQTEGLKQDAFKSKVQAYAAQVDAAAKVIQAKIEEYKGRIEAKQAEYEGYKTTVSAESEKARAISANNQSLASIFQAQASSRSAYNEALLKKWQSAVELAQKNVALGVDAGKANIDGYINQRQIVTDSYKSIASTYAQIASAAFNQYNASQSYNSSWGISANFSESNSVSESASI